MPRNVIINARGTDVDVTEEAATRGDAPATRFTGTAGTTTVSRVVTFGGEDGPRPDVTLEDMQALFDKTRVEVAEEVAWQEEIKALLAQVN